MHSGAGVFTDRGVKMVGVLNRPAGERRRPAVLFLHGFPGAEKSVDVQRQLLRRGVGSFALHFRGAWGSEGYYCFADLIRQARAGLRFLSRQAFVDGRRLGVYGFSMGGWTAINMAAREPLVRAVAAIAPVGGGEMVVSRTGAYLARQSRSLRVWGPGTLGRDFAAAVRANDPAEAARRLGRPLLLVHGSEDDVVPPEVSRRVYEAARQPKRLVIAAGARHDFLDRREWLARLAGDWLAQSLS